MKEGSLAQKLSYAVAGSAAVRIGGMVVTLLVGVQLARYLGPAGYGIYGTVMALVAVMTVPAQLGLPQLVTREISAFMETGGFARVKGAMIWFAITITAASAIMMFFGYVGFQLWPGDTSQEYSQAYAWGLVSITLISMVNYSISGLRGFHHVVSAQIYDALVRPALFATFLFIGASMFAGLDAPTAMAIQALAGVLTLILCVLHLLRVTPQTVRSKSAERHSSVWRKSATPMACTEILRVLDGHYAVLLLGTMAAIDQVGIFRVALAMAGFAGMPSTLINLVVMPYVAQFHAARDIKRLQMIATGSAMAMFVGTLVILFAIIFFGESFLIFAFGEEFAPAWWPLTLMTIAYVINGMFGPVAIILNMCGHEHTVSKAFLIGPFVGVVITASCFDTFGIAAASIAMVVSELIKGLIMWWGGKHYISLDTSIISIPTFFRRRIQGSSEPEVKHG